MRFHLLLGQSQTCHRVGTGLVVCGIRHYISTQHVPFGKSHSGVTFYPCRNRISCVDRHWCCGYSAFGDFLLSRAGKFPETLFHLYPDSLNHRAEIGLRKLHYYNVHSTLQNFSIFQLFLQFPYKVAILGGLNEVHLLGGFLHIALGIT